MRSRAKRFLMEEGLVREPGLAAEAVHYMHWSPPTSALSLTHKILSHPRRQFLFILLSAADLTLTWWLLTCSKGRIYEANPIASPWLRSHGLFGLACFKGGLVLLVLGLVLTIEQLQPRAAKMVLNFGCVCVALVVSYSFILYMARPY